MPLALSEVAIRAGDGGEGGRYGSGGGVEFGGRGGKFCADGVPGAIDGRQNWRGDGAGDAAV